MSNKEWPESITPLSAEEWLELATSEDAKEAQKVGKTLKALGYGAREFVKWEPDQRVETIMKHQPAMEEEKPKGRRSSKASTKGASTKRSTSRTSKTSSTKAASGSGGGGLSEDDRGVIAEILETVQGLSSRNDELEGQLEHLEAFIKETHYGFMMIAMGDDKLDKNFRDPSIQEDIYGELQLEVPEGED